MQKITSLLKNLENNPELAGISFSQGDEFRWDHTSKTVFYLSTDPDVASYLLHEAGHAALSHQDYPDDINLVAMERAAWDKATALGKQYTVALSDHIIEDALDSYRNWLHSRSTCPSCGSTGIQTSYQAYECLACHTRWKVNEARSCALRRYTS
jgi:hypothetical protein